LTQDATPSRDSADWPHCRASDIFPSQVQKPGAGKRFFARKTVWREEIPRNLKTAGAELSPSVLEYPHRTRVAATTEEPEMTEVLPSRQALPSRAKSFRTYASVLVFLAVYLGVLVVVFAPKDMISAQTGAIFAGSD
jgi:hypothetical protein